MFTATAALHWHLPQSGPGSLEDGTLPFLEIVALEQGLEVRGEGGTGGVGGGRGWRCGRREGLEVWREGRGWRCGGREGLEVWEEGGAGSVGVGRAVGEEIPLLVGTKGE